MSRHRRRRNWLRGIDGYELCQLLRRDVTTTTMPIVLVATEAALTTRECERAAVADVIPPKSCHVSVLLEEMRRLVERSRELRRHSESLHARAARQLTRSQALQTHWAATPRSERPHQPVQPSEIAPPAMVCPKCDQLLVYRSSYVGAVNARNQEQWDYYQCPSGCGIFQYRQRTRKRRNISGSVE